MAIDPLTPATLYAGTSAGVYKSTDRAASWTAVNDGLTATDIRCLAIDPVTPTTLYAGTVGVFRSTDAGVSWSAINAGLPTSVLFIALTVNPATPSALYAGSEGRGIFANFEVDSSWGAINVGLTNNNVHGIAIDRTTSTAYAATYGGAFVFR